MLGALNRIVDFFAWIVDTVKSLVEFVWRIILGTLDLLAMLPDLVATLTDSITWLPTFLASFAVATITVCSIFIIINREGGGKN